MRRSLIASLVAVFALACADAPSAPSLEPMAPNFAVGEAPPPWALIEGDVTTDGSGASLSLSFSRSGDGSARLSHGVPSTATYRAWLLVTPGEQAALLRFIDGTNVTFSNGAMITKVTTKGNTKVSGRGTMTVDGDVYELSSVTDFNAYRECTTALGARCADFDGEGFSSAGPATWTGRLSSDGGNGGPPNWDGGKPGNGPPIDCGFECAIIRDFQ